MARNAHRARPCVLSWPQEISWSYSAHAPAQADDERGGSLCERKVFIAGKPSVKHVIGRSGIKQSTASQRRRPLIRSARRDRTRGVLDDHGLTSALQVMEESESHRPVHLPVRSLPRGYPGDLARLITCGGLAADRSSC